MIDLLAELRSVISSLDIAGIPYALCGGLAMAVHGFPRATVDIDILILGNKLHPSEHPLSLDVLLVTPAVQQVWDDRQSMEWDFGKISVVSPAGLIALKSLRGSGRDQDDIKRLQGESE